MSVALGLIAVVLGPVVMAASGDHAMTASVAAPGDHAATATVAGSGDHAVTASVAGFADPPVTASVARQAVTSAPRDAPPSASAAAEGRGAVGTDDGAVGFRLEAGVATYSNNDGLTVITPWGQASQQVTESILVTAGWKADVISAASVDVITQATERFDETRNEGQLSVDLDFTEIRGSVAYIGSVESDTNNHMIVAGGELDLLQRNLTLGLRYGLGLDKIGTALEPADLWRDRMLNQVDLSVSQVLTRSTVVCGAYTFQPMSGLLSSAYRHVPIFPRGDGPHLRTEAHWVPERHPDTRDRHSITLDLKQALSPAVFVAGSYRFYLDTWAMRAHTGAVIGTVDVGSGLSVEVSNRLHWQSSVSFYRAVYTVSRDYMTRDRRLAQQLSNISGLAIRFLRLGGWPTVEAVLRGEVHWTRDADVFKLEDELIAVPDTVAVVGQAGLALGF